MNKQERAQELELRLEHELFELEADLAAGYTEHYMEVLAFYASFHHYSFGNSMLIRQQLPTATRCAGMRKWNELGYKVRKGETAIWIRCPWLRKEVDAETGEIEQKLIGYLPVAVFDVSQLDDGSKLPSVSYELPGDFEDAYLSAKAWVICSGIIVAEYPLPPGLHGLAWPGHITIAAGLSTSEKLATLYHELAHIVAEHHAHHDDIPLKQRELEAESAAWLISRVNGVTIPWSADYIRSYKGEVTGLHQSFRRISDIVKRCLEILRFEELSEAA